MASDKVLRRGAILGSLTLLGLAACNNQPNDLGEPDQGVGEPDNGAIGAPPASPDNGIGSPDDGIGSTGGAERPPESGAVGQPNDGVGAQEQGAAAQTGQTPAESNDER